jgi:hypothetical protein
MGLEANTKAKQRMDKAKMKSKGVKIKKVKHITYDATARE